jgi:hypothetical protein
MQRAATAGPQHLLSLYAAHTSLIHAKMVRIRPEIVRMWSRFRVSGSVEIIRI